ncbi:Protein of unknown function [Pyronema omphalodes CBS 100304]|uniref:Uncharacterized protein n=1 Tax=Pyronema omphalodes (strain CBS 100304) TaxID=1076935 RepID=U4LWE0_PYROM|nr:Protein of unknown function [Pyronema omphalodes CBS 100304]
MLIIFVIEDLYRILPESLCIQDCAFFFTQRACVARVARCDRH